MLAAHLFRLARGAEDRNTTAHLICTAMGPGLVLLMLLVARGKEK